jgi:hypothetical protein
MDFSTETGEICFFPAPVFPAVHFEIAPTMRRFVLLITLLIATLAWGGFLVMAIRLTGKPIGRAFAVSDQERCPRPSPCP